MVGQKRSLFSPNVSPLTPHRNVERKVKKEDVLIPKPYVSDLYTQNMGGVDLSDQIRSYYSIGRQSRKWYQYIFWFLFNVCACNGLILENIHRRKAGITPRTQIQFRLALAKELINGSTQRKRPLQSPEAATFSPNQTNTSMRSESGKKECVQCKKCNRKTPKGYYVETKFKCKQCGVALCKGRCFREYHGATVE